MLEADPFAFEPVTYVSVLNHHPVHEFVVTHKGALKDVSFSPTRSTAILTPQYRSEKDPPIGAVARAAGVDGVSVSKAYEKHGWKLLRDLYREWYDSVREKSRSKPDRMTKGDNAGADGELVGDAGDVVKAWARFCLFQEMAHDKTRRARVGGKTFTRALLPPAVRAMQDEAAQAYKAGEWAPGLDA